MPRGSISESEGGRDKPLGSRASSQRKSRQPDFSGFADARQPMPEPAPQKQSDFRGPADDQRSTPPAGQRHERGSGHSLRALFGAAKKAICRKDAPAPQPSRRRRGETDKGFVAAYRKMLRRAPKRQARTMGGNAAFADLCASAGVFLSDTLDWLNLGEDSAAYDHWHEEEFSATYDYFPQP